MSEGQKEAKNADLDRIKEIKGWSGHGSDAQLCRFLGVSKQVLYGWRVRGSIDWDKVREKLTPEEMGQLMNAGAMPLSSVGPSDSVSRTELLEHLLRLNKRIDRLEAELQARCPQTDKPAPKA